MVVVAVRESKEAFSYTGEDSGRWPKHNKGGLSSGSGAKSIEGQIVVDVMYTEK